MVTRLLVPRLGDPAKPPDQVEPRGIQRLSAFHHSALQDLTLPSDLVLIGLEPESVADARGQVVGIDRLAEEIRRPFVQGSPLQIPLVGARHHDHRDVVGRGRGRDGPEEIETIPPGKHDVRDDRVHGP